MSAQPGEKAIFEIACGIADNETRRQYLEQACGEDRNLRIRVEALLRVLDRDVDLIGARVGEPGPASPAADTQTHGWPIPQNDEPPTGWEANPAGYQLQEVLGEGGMGVVYRARDTELGRDVALKFLRCRFPAAGPAARRFLDEVRITAQLQHPGIPPVHEVGTLPDGRPFLAMKLIKGRTLADLLEEKLTNRGELVGQFERVCQAVAYAHDHGVVHRDLKPANVMIGAFGEVQVMDWGLAKVLVTGAGQSESTVHDKIPSTATAIESDRDEGDVTQVGSVIGTPAYMPPEQAIGAIDQVDARSDVFGLGAILCTILTGQPPYIGSDFESVRRLSARAQMADAYARLDNCGADPGLVGLCKQCLSPEQGDRPADAGIVAKTVGGLRAVADERARQAELDRVRAEGERSKAEAEAREQRKRRRVQVALGLVFVAFIAVGVAFAWWTREKRLAAEAEDRERQAAANLELTRVVEAAAAAHARAQAGRDPALWAEARAAARQAADRAAATDATTEVRDKVDRLMAEVEQKEKNHRLVAALLDVRAGVGDQLTPTGMLDFAATAERYERAFREYGVDPLALDPNAAANLLGALAGDARVDLAAALDDWAYVGSTARLLATFSQLGGKPPQDDRHQTVGPLFAVTRLLDPDPFRKQLREAITNNDGPALKRLVEEIDPAAHPAQTIHLATLFLSRMEPSALEAAIRLLRRSHPHHSGDFHVNHDLTYFLLQSQQPAEALPYAAAAVALRPHSAVAWHNWAVALERAGRPTDAVAALRRVYTLSPANLTSRVWAIALLDRTGDRVGAAAVRDELNKLAPNPAHLSDAYLIIGVGFRAEGDRTAAEAALREAIRHNPKQVGAYQQLASMLRRRGELNASMDVYREGIRCVPYWIGGLNDLAWLLATGPIEAPDRQEAVRLATEACRLTGRKNPALLDTLAAAHAAADDFKQAVSVQEEALRLEASAKRPDNGGHDRLELYRRNISYRETSVVLSESGPPPREVTP